MPDTVNNGYIVRQAPGHPNASVTGQILEHIYVIAEVLGRALSKGEVVHHIDENRSNNSPSNLMLFASQSEHVIHHRKMRALAESGNAEFRKCSYCKIYDDPEKMVIRGKHFTAHHKECDKQYKRNHYLASKLH